MAHYYLSGALPPRVRYDPRLRHTPQRLAETTRPPRRQVPRVRAHYYSRQGPRLDSHRLLGLALPRRIVAQTRGQAKTGRCPFSVEAPSPSDSGDTCARPPARLPRPARAEGPGSPAARARGCAFAASCPLVASCDGALTIALGITPGRSPRTLPGEGAEDATLR